MKSKEARKIAKVIIEKQKEILEIWVNADARNLITLYHKGIDALQFLLTDHARLEKENGELRKEVEADHCEDYCQEIALYKRELASLKKKLKKAEILINKIGNTLGAPTTNYYPRIEGEELIERIHKIARLIILHKKEKK